ncbi:hypothetical protein VNO78_22075 [Psophocarpus tetragonolobus]|uniref:KOW domain-containing protein n=1 Tax=Psophocarpus tetragonolobus TaxID=3891 RepID=A0AAN9XI45_PSOTE
MGHLRSSQRTVMLSLIITAVNLVTGQISTPCTTSMVNTITPCANFITGSINNGLTPSATCCDSLLSLISTRVDCACLLISANVPFPVPINKLLAFFLPQACNVHEMPALCKVSGSPLPAPGPPLLGSNDQTVPPVTALSPLSPEVSKTFGEVEATKYEIPHPSLASTSPMKKKHPRKVQEIGHTLHCCAKIPHLCGHNWICTERGLNFEGSYSFPLIRTITLPHQGTSPMGWKAAEKLIRHWKILRGDNVMIIRGKDKGDTGIVKRVIRSQNRLIVEGKNLVKKHIKQGQGHEGGIFTVEAPLHASNVQVLDPVTGKPCKVGIKYLEDGTKVRVSRGIGASGSIIPRPEILKIRTTPRPTVLGPKDTPIDLVLEKTYDAKTGRGMPEL